MDHRERGERHVLKSLRDALARLPALDDRPLLADSMFPVWQPPQPVHHFNRIVANSSSGDRLDRPDGYVLAARLLGHAHHGRTRQRQVRAEAGLNPLRLHHGLAWALAGSSERLPRCAVVSGYLQGLDAQTVMAMTHMGYTDGQSSGYASPEFPAAVRALARAVARHHGDLGEAQVELAGALRQKRLQLPAPNTPFRIHSRSLDPGPIEHRCWVVPGTTNPQLLQLRDALFDDGRAAPLADGRTELMVVMPMHRSLSRDSEALALALHRLIAAEQDSGACYTGARPCQTMLTDIPGLALGMARDRESGTPTARLDHVLCLRTENGDESPHYRFAGHPALTVVGNPAGGVLPLNQVDFRRLLDLARQTRHRETATRGLRTATSVVGAAVQATRSAGRSRRRR